MLINYPYTNLQEQKARPAIIISNNNFNKTLDCILVPLTTQLRHEGILLKEQDILEGELFRESKMLTRKIFTLEQDLILCRFAHIRTHKMKELIFAVEQNF